MRERVPSAVSSNGGRAWGESAASTPAFGQARRWLIISRRKSGTELNALEAIQQEAVAGKLSGYTHTFDTPFTFEGRTYDTLTFDFSKLSGDDDIAIENELQALGKPVVVHPPLQRGTGAIPEYESVSGQYQLWDEAAKVVATSAGSINSALESQITYWQDYNANLQSLTDRSADIEGLSDMIASFADGSSDSVNAIAGMAGATDEQLATMVANWKTLQQEQQNAAGSVADLKTDFTATMDELQTALAEDIEAMDLGDEAKASAQATIQGFIDGAVGMLPQVTAAYNRVAAAARAALSASGTGTAGSIPGYAVGTQSAAPGFALVGENGPELVYFNGGEQVMTAEETAAMRESMEIQAITFAPQLLEAMHTIQGDGALSASLPGQSSELPPIIIENTFHVEGNATPETIAALADYGDSLKEVVREAIAEIEEDVSRTMYR